MGKQISTQKYKNGIHEEKGKVWDKILRQKAYTTHFHTQSIQPALS